MGTFTMFMWGIKVTKDNGKYNTLDEVLRLVPKHLRKAFREKCEHSNSDDPQYELAYEFAISHGFLCEFTDNGIYWGLLLKTQDLDSDRLGLNITEVSKLVTLQIQEKYLYLQTQVEVKGEPAIWMIAERNR